MAEPNDRGPTYNHGTLSGYTAGRCRCDYCRGAFALYRAARRAGGNDHPRPLRTRMTDGHIPNDWFRRNIWYPAITAAGLDFRPTMRDLRHAHALAPRYLHTLPDADETALEALARTSNRSTTR